MGCNLYKIPSGLTPVTIIYTDCDGVDQPVPVPGGSDYYFCSTNLISTPLETEDLGECKCQCFYVYSTGSLSEITVNYVDCDGNLAILTNLTTGMRFCGLKFLLSNDGSGAIVSTSGTDCVLDEGYNCPTNNSTCYTIDNGVDPVHAYFIDSTGTPQLISELSGPINFCATDILVTSYNANGSIVAGIPSGTITSNGLCGVDPISGEYICASENCECYVVTSTFDNTLVEYIDCNNNILTGYTSGSNSAIGIYASLIVCSKLILTPGLSFYNLGDCNTSVCHISLCDCYTIPENVGAYGIIYLDCNDNVVTIENNERVNPKTSFCAKTILDDNTGLVTKGYPCIDGVCITSPPPTNPLLYTLLKLRGPCPDICSGQVKLGGITGTDEINIITQNPL